MGRKVLLGAVVPILFAASAASAATPAQLPGTAGCISVTGKAGCAAGRAIGEAVGPLAISPDGKSAYLVANSNPEGIESDALDVFDRDPATGALAQKPGAEGCLAASGREGCLQTPMVYGAHEAVVSPDGRNVYVANERGVVAFSRDTTTGALTLLSGPGECLGGKKVKAPCEIGVGLSGAISLALSPDGGQLYVTSDAHPTVAILRRDQLTGALSQAGGTAGCVVAAKGSPSCDAAKLPSGSAPGIAVAPDGQGVYVIVDAETPAGFVNTRLESFARNAAGGLRRLGGTRAGCLHFLHGKPCPGGRGLRSIEAVALSPDGRSLYLTSGYSSKAGAISIFRRGPGNKLTQVADKQACLSANGGECRRDPALAFAGEVTVSPDGTGVYVDTLYGIAVLARDEAGRLTVPRGAGACVSDFKSSCLRGRGLEATTGVAVSPDSKNLYVTSLEPGGVAVFRR
jgi:DNA-binding beta-propeller fold protein YncE